MKATFYTHNHPFLYQNCQSKMFVFLTEFSRISAKHSVIFWGWIRCSYYTFIDKVDFNTSEKDLKTKESKNNGV